MLPAAIELSALAQMKLFCTIVILILSLLIGMRMHARPQITLHVAMCLIATNMWKCVLAILIALGHLRKFLLPLGSVRINLLISLQSSKTQNLEIYPRIDNVFSPHLSTPRILGTYIPAPPPPPMYMLS